MNRVIPQRFQATCAFCGMELDVRASGVYSYVAGWVKNRKAGGANAITMPYKNGQYACAPCIDLNQNQGVIQGALF